MSVLPNTSETDLGLIRSLRIQPLLVVLRPERIDLEAVFFTTRLCRQLDQRPHVAILPRGVLV